MDAHYGSVHHLGYILGTIGLRELNRWKYTRSLHTNALEGRRIYTQRLQNRRRHLGGAN